jgi:hypothetical protein
MYYHDYTRHYKKTAVEISCVEGMVLLYEYFADSANIACVFPSFSRRIPRRMEKRDF